jgi:hypothetical protein
MHIFNLLFDNVLFKVQVCITKKTPIQASTLYKSQRKSYPVVFSLTRRDSLKCLLTY